MAQTHKIVSGDTASAIAKKYGTTVDELQAANPQYSKFINNPNYIQAGWTLNIPGMSARVADTTPTPHVEPSVAPPPTLTGTTPTSDGQWQSIEERPQSQKEYEQWKADPNKKFNKITGTWETKTSTITRIPLPVPINQTDKLQEIGGKIDTKLAEKKALEAGEQERQQIEEDANKTANEIFENVGDDVDIRDSSEILDEIETMMDDIGEAPEPTSMADLFASKREELGLDALETELADLDSQIEAINVNLLVQAEEAGEKLLSMGEIGREKGLLQKRADREIALLNVERSAVARQLTNKYNTLEMVMGFTQQDFANASAYYTNQFNKTMTLYNLIRGEEQYEESRADKLTSTASANLNIIVDAMSNSGLTFTDLDDAQKLKISNLEIQAGFPSGIFESILENVDTSKGLQTTITSSDKTKISFIYDDGSIATFDTGLPVEASRADLLSVAEAKSLGVPYGTTKAEAAEMGITPDDDNDDTKIISDFNKALTAPKDDEVREEGFRERLLAKLLKLYPQIDPGDISRAVYEYYTDEYISKLE